MTVKGNTAICDGKRLSSKELKASNARHFLKDGDRLLQYGTKIYRTSVMDLRHQMIELNVYNDYIYIYIYTFSFPCAEHTPVVAYPGGRRRSRTALWMFSVSLARS